MRSTSPRRTTVLVATLLLLLTAAPWASAGPRHEGGYAAGISGAIVIPDLLSRAWSLLIGIWTKEGCQIDPGGRCQPVVSSPLPTKEGCQIDPSGHHCVSQPILIPSADIGCNIDPDGRCHQ